MGTQGSTPIGTKLGGKLEEYHLEKVIKTKVTQRSCPSHCACSTGFTMTNVSHIPREFNDTYIKLVVFWYLRGHFPDTFLTFRGKCPERYNLCFKKVVEIDAHVTFSQIYPKTPNLAQQKALVQSRACRNRKKVKTHTNTDVYWSFWVPKSDFFEKIQTELPFKAWKVTFWAKIVKFRKSCSQTCKIPQESVCFGQK